LSAAGLNYAGQGATVRIANGHFSYVFTGSTPVRVLTSEWRRVLSLKLHLGQPVFEMAPAAPVTATPATPAAAAPVTHVISAPASHTDAPTASETTHEVK
jgi:hypothetical protein